VTSYLVFRALSPLRAPIDRSQEKHPSSSILMSDEHLAYQVIGRSFAAHFFGVQSLELS
jgi:hypothetical protein